MKQKLLALLFSFFMAAPLCSDGQAYSFAADTVHALVGSTIGVFDSITNRTGATVSLTWHVIDCNFPPDWLTATAFGLCDNFACTSNSGNVLWDAGTSTGASHTAYYYANATHDSVGAYELVLDLSAATTLGCHYVTIAFTDGTTAKNMTFIVCKVPAVVPAVTSVAGDISLFPNPAVNSGMLRFNLASQANVTIKVMDGLGRTVSSLPAQNMAAGEHMVSLPVNSLSAGIYTIAVQAGEALITRKLSVMK
jgi:Secretion system C-terminal sorting domain